MAGMKYSPGFDDPSARPLAVALRRVILFATVAVAVTAVVAITFWLRPSLWDEVGRLVGAIASR
jgi:hypothetical protein